MLGTEVLGGNPSSCIEKNPEIYTYVFVMVFKFAVLQS